MDRILDGKPHVEAEDAARELQTTHLRLLMLLKQEKLAGCQVGGEWFVERSSLDCLKKHGLDPLEMAACRTSCSASSCGCKG
jgi:hypothetical protein